MTVKRNQKKKEREKKNCGFSFFSLILFSSFIMLRKAILREKIRVWVREKERGRFERPRKRELFIFFN